MNDFKKVIYICEIGEGIKAYYRQEYLIEDIRWGSPRPITRQTFEKRKKEGYHIEYRPMKKLPNNIIARLEDIDTMIDLSLQMKDKEWFMELSDKRNKVLKGE